MVLELELEAAHVGREHPDRLLEQLLARLVALEHDDAQTHVANPTTNPSCTWCGTQVDPGDGYRLAERPGARVAAFCRLEHVVPWAIQGPHWEAGELREPGEEPHECSHCDARLGELRLLLVRHRGAHRIPDAFCSVDHLAAWAKSGGRWRQA